MTSNWNKTDERCPTCNSVTKVVRGPNKQNIKKLFFTKPSIQDIMILILIVLTLLAALQYQKEVTYYKEQAAKCNINNPIIPNYYEDINFTIGNNLNNILNNNE